MKTAMLNIKIDPKIKKEAGKIAEDLGFSLSAIVNASLKDLTRRKTVHFSILEPNTNLADIIRKTRAERKKGESIGPFSSALGMMESLNS